MGDAIGNVGASTSPCTDTFWIKIIERNQN
jgi:hypothetical protein